MHSEPITQALQRAERGEPGAHDALWELVYAELKNMAAARVARLGPGQTLHATALVHEAWVRLGSDQAVGWQGRAHFFGAAARSMRNILVDHFRSRRAQKRGDGRAAETLPSGLHLEDEAGALDILALDEALQALQREHERPARIVNLRFFAGLGIAEIADLLQVTTRTVDRDYLFARTWLRRFMASA
jgi:RNA polymerase sigma factor (TIGR02999 family)